MTSPTSGTSGNKLEFEQIRRMIQRDRLLRLALDESANAFIREAMVRAGIGPGASVVDVGCGPLGGLPVLAELVGSHGTVVGIDRSESVLAVARRVLDEQGLGSVQLIEANINDLDVHSAGLAGRFDAAYCRLFLENQTDPAATLGRMAQLVRPGGFIVAHELLDDPHYPIFDPPVPEFGRFFSLVQQTLRAQGKSADVGRRYSMLVREAGLEEVSQRGLIDANPAAAAGFIEAQGVGMLMVFKHGFIELGLAARAEVDQLSAALSAATQQQYRTFFSWVTAELIARVPA